MIARSNGRVGGMANIFSLEGTVGLRVQPEFRSHSTLRNTSMLRAHIEQGGSYSTVVLVLVCGIGKSILKELQYILRTEVHGTCMHSMQYAYCRTLYLVAHSFRMTFRRQTADGQYCCY